MPGKPIYDLVPVSSAWILSYSCVMNSAALTPKIAINLT
jgi:hypothetical protein